MDIVKALGAKTVLTETFGPKRFLFGNLSFGVGGSGHGAERSGWAGVLGYRG